MGLWCSRGSDAPARENCKFVVTVCTSFANCVVLSIQHYSTVFNMGYRSGISYGVPDRFVPPMLCATFHGTDFSVSFYGYRQLWY